jgi:hypothetical protein
MKQRDWRGIVLKTLVTKSCLRSNGMSASLTTQGYSLNICATSEMSGHIATIYALTCGTVLCEINARVFCVFSQPDQAPVILRCLTISWIRICRNYLTLILSLSARFQPGDKCVRFRLGTPPVSKDCQPRRTSRLYQQCVRAAVIYSLTMYATPFTLFSHSFTRVPLVFFRFVSDDKYLLSWSLKKSIVNRLKYILFSSGSGREQAESLSLVVSSASDHGTDGEWPFVKSQEAVRNWEGYEGIGTGTILRRVLDIPCAGGSADRLGRRAGEGMRLN